MNSLLLLLTLLTFSLALTSASPFQLVESIPLKTQGLSTNKTTFESWREMIQSAQYKISIVCMYMDLSDGIYFLDAGGEFGVQVYEMLNDALKKGLEVQILAQKPNSQFDSADLDHFKDAGANLRLIDWSKIVGGGILHTKIIVVDDRSFYVGSANMDWKSLIQVKEMGIYVQDNPVLTADVMKVFGTYWVAAQNSTVPTPWPTGLNTIYNSTNPHIIDDDNTMYIASSPESFVVPHRTLDIDALVQTIEEAKKTVCIEVMDYYPGTFYMKPNIFWPTIDTALRKASFNGVKVKFLVSKWAHSKKQVWQYLKSLNELDNIEVRIFEIPEWDPIIPFTRVNHAKFMVTDHHSFIGTSNWSADYFIDTAGISVNWEGPTITTSLQAVFNRDWDSIYSRNVNNL